MKRIFTFAFFLFFALSSSAQQFSAEEASRKIGDSIKVCGTIYGGRFFETSNGSPTLLNMGAAYPSSPLTLMIPLSVRMKMGYEPEIQLKGKEVCVLGRVILFKDKPEIIIYNAGQIQMK
jgi:hypothetical protein